MQLNLKGGNRLKSHLVLGIMSLFCGGICAGCAKAVPATNESPPAIDQPAATQEASGIKVERITYAVGGMKLDLRYRVTDLSKARQLFSQHTPLSLVDQATGTILAVPNMAKVGKLRQLPNQDEPWRVYWIFFDNPGVLVKKGGKVTLVIGDTKIRDIIVE